MNVFEYIATWLREPWTKPERVEGPDCLIFTAVSEDVCDRIKKDPCVYAMLRDTENPQANYRQCRKRTVVSEVLSLKKVVYAPENDLIVTAKNESIHKINVRFVFQALRRRDWRLNFEAAPKYCRNGNNDEFYVFGSKDRQLFYTVLQNYEDADFCSAVSDWYRHQSGWTRKKTASGWPLPESRPLEFRKDIDERIWAEITKFISDLREFLSDCEKNNLGFIVCVEWQERLHRLREQAEPWHEN